MDARKSTTIDPASGAGARAGAANLMLVTLLIPPFAIGLGIRFLDESPGPQAWAGFAIIALGLGVTDGRLAARLRGTAQAG